VQRLLSGTAPATNPAVPAGLALAGVLAGAAIAFADVKALTLCAALLGCAYILFDFRIGVVLLIVLMPLSRSALFPHAMFGITGLNPVNLLLAATLGAWLMRSLGDGGWRRFLPRPLLWLYLAPLVAAGALGARHVEEIVPGYYLYGLIQFQDTAGYLRDMLFKPLLLVLFALLVAAAAARSAKPEAFLVPACLSIWVMGAIVLGYVLHSGAGLGALASGGARSFLSPLGIHANDLGRLYVSAYALLLFTAAGTERAAARPLLLASLALVALALMLTFSRGAFLGFMLVNLLFLVLRRSGKLLLLAALLATAAPLLLPEAVLERVGAGVGQGANAVSAGRIDGLWLPLVPDVLRSPLYGSGLGSILWSGAMHDAQAGAVGIIGATHPHNAYLEALLDMGVVGLALLGAYYLHLWRDLRALAADASLNPTLRGFFQGAVVGLAAMLAIAVADSSLAPRAEQVYLWLAVGLMYGQRR
jgi:O-antigen ligase/polysaccharide polymerase Wzy-like membrane protein